MSEDKAIEILTNAKDVRLTTGESVQVHGLSWGDAFRFLKRAGDGVGKLIAVKDDGNVAIDFGRVQELILESEDMVNVLLAGSIARDLSERIDRLPIEDVLALVDAALELTVTPGLKKNASALGERLKALVPSSTKQPTQSTTSSPRDIPSKPSPATPSGNSTSTSSART